MFSAISPILFNNTTSSMLMSGQHAASVGNNTTVVYIDIHSNLRICAMFIHLMEFLCISSLSLTFTQETPNELISLR